MIYYCCDCGDELPTDWVLGHFEEDEVVQGVVPCRKCYKLPYLISSPTETKQPVSSGSKLTTT